MDYLTNPKFIQALMKSSEAKTENVPSLFNPMIQTSKSMKASYEPEKYFLESQFDKNIISVYHELSKSFFQQQDPAVAIAIREEIWSLIENLSEYEIYLLMKELESRFFGLRAAAIQKIKTQYPNHMQSLMRREILLQQSEILKEMMEFGIPLTNKLHKYIQDNLYVFADIFSRNPEDKISGYDINVSPNPIEKYRNYYYKIFNTDLDIYVDYQFKQRNLERLKNYIRLS